MRLVIQRVRGAGVKACMKDGVEVAGGELGDVGRIPGAGMMVLVGIHASDTEEDMNYCVKKIMKTRLWENAKGQAWGSCITDIMGGILLVSQFTLHASLK